MHIFNCHNWVSVSAEHPVVQKYQFHPDHRTDRSGEYQGVQKQGPWQSNLRRSDEGQQNSEGSGWFSQNPQNNALAHFSYENMGHISVPKNHAHVCIMEQGVFVSIRMESPAQTY